MCCINLRCRHETGVIDDVGHIKNALLVYPHGAVERSVGRSDREEPVQRSVEYFKKRAAQSGLESRSLYSQMGLAPHEHRCTRRLSACYSNQHRGWRMASSNK